MLLPTMGSRARLASVATTLGVPSLQHGNCIVSTLSTRAMNARAYSLVVGSDGKHHFTGRERLGALIANGRAVRVAAQILQRLCRSTQRRIGIHHPLVAVQRFAPLGPVARRALRVACGLGQPTGPVGLRLGVV